MKTERKEKIIHSLIPQVKIKDKNTQLKGKGKNNVQNSVRIFRRAQNLLLKISGSPRIL